MRPHGSILPRLLRPAAVLLLALAGSAGALAAVPVEPRLVRVPLTPGVTAGALLEAGLDVVHVRHGAFAEVLEWPGDDAVLARLGARVELLDATPSRSAAERARAGLAARPRPASTPVWSAARPDGVVRTEFLPPVGYGSMGGFWTLEEVKMKLDDLVASDTRGLVADRVDTLGWSVLGRPIWGLRIGTQVAGSDPRPVVFYNALVHAREPGGMQALLWFVDDLLARHGTDPFATTLLEQRVIYVVPVANPDGYKLNQQLFPGGGGMHRKNLRDNDDNGQPDYGADGVDLNRNFGFAWGHDDTGSSGNPSHSTYRGPAPFSEPETQAQRDIVALLGPRTGLSFHTYSDVLVHSWGYTVAGAPDSAAFCEWDDEITHGNGYQAGPAPRVLYPVNGDFNDWCYGDTLLKPRAFTWTPEVGSYTDGFWPQPSRIVPLAEENLRAAYFSAALAGAFVRVESAAVAEQALNAGGDAHLAVRARNRGLGGTGAPVAASLLPLDPGVEVLAGAAGYPALPPLSSADAQDGGTFHIAAHDTVTPGRLVRFEIAFSGTGHFSRDTVELVVGTPTVLFLELANDLAQWSAVGPWGPVTNDPRHPGSYLTDSPPGAYPNNVTHSLVATPHLDLSAGVHAWVEMEARWAFEADFDGLLVEASLDSLDWVPLHGGASVPGRSVPGRLPAGEPAYQGSRWNWAPERLDLSPFTGAQGDSVRLRLRLVSDTYTQADGFSFDSLRILLYDAASQPGPVASAAPHTPGAWVLDPPAPTPARGATRLGFVLPRAGEARLEILDLQGRRVRTLASGPRAAGRHEAAWDLRDESGRPVAPGLYLARLGGAGGPATRRLVVLH